LVEQPKAVIITISKSLKIEKLNQKRSYSIPLKLRIG
jgi:hypothetical protein